MTEAKNLKPLREPDLTDSGDGAPPDDIRGQAEAAYYAELYVDALGDPDGAPLGWWHLKLWTGP